MINVFKIIDTLEIGTNDRVSIFGKTGAGKTFFSKNWLLPHYSHYVFWDIKHENNDVLHDIIVSTPKELKKEIVKNNRILYQPRKPNDEDFNEVCEIIFNSGNMALYVDESAFVSTPSKILYWHKVLITQGRSYGSGIVNVSQRPRDIHNTLISESEHLFIFVLSLETDIMKLKYQIGDAADEISALQEHYFIYYSVRTNKSFLFKPVKLLDTKEVPYKIHELELYRPNLDEYIKLIS